MERDEETSQAAGAEKSSKLKCAGSSAQRRSHPRVHLTLGVMMQLLRNWYRDASDETEDALYDIKSIWNSTDDDTLEKLYYVNRLVIYYFLLIALHIIHVCFVIDQHLIEGLFKIINKCLEQNPCR